MTLEAWPEQSLWMVQVAVAAVQLATPLVAGIGGVSVLGEPFGWRLAAGGALILIGLGLTLRRPAAK